MRRWLVVSGLACIATLIAVSAAAQQRSRISGTVTDEQGEPIEGCVVMAENPANMPSTLETTTNEKGNFSFSGVRSGLWRLKYGADGFHPFQEEFQVGGRERVRRKVELVRATGQALLTRSKEARAEVDAANQAMAAGDYAKAVELYEQILAKAPEVYEIYFNIGLAQEQLGDHAAAASAYEKFLESDPENADAMLKLAIALNRSGKIEKALALYEEVTELQPDSGIAHFNMALVLFQNERLDKAKEAFERSLALDTSLNEAHFMLGHIHVSQGEPSLALASYEKFVELAPDSPNAEAARQAIEQLKR